MNETRPCGERVRHSNEPTMCPERMQGKLGPSEPKILPCATFLGGSPDATTAAIAPGVCN